MDVLLKNQQLRWDGNGEKSALEDYNEKEEKWEQEQNNFRYIIYIYGENKKIKIKSQKKKN